MQEIGKRAMQETTRRKCAGALPTRMKRRPRISRARPFHDYGAVMFIMGLRDFPGAASDNPRDRIHIATRLPASASGNKTSCAHPSDTRLAATGSRSYSYK